MGVQMHFAAIWEAVADVMGDRPAVVQGERAISWQQYDERASRLAGALVAAGLGPGSKVGMYLYNSTEYCETNFGAMKFGAIPINVNYRYLDDELRYLLDNSDAEAVVFNTSLGDRIARVTAGLSKVKLLVEVDDGPAPDGSTHVDGAIAYDDLLAAHDPLERRSFTGDEIYMLYTGGTTGMPKGVMYPLSDFTSFFVKGYPSMIGLPALASADELLAAVEASRDGNQLVAMSGPPLMHGTGCWLGMMVPHMFGGTACLLESRSLDPAEVWTVVERRGVQHLIIVGDAFAKPLVRALETEPDRWDLSSLRLMISSGAMFSTEVKQRLFDFVPQLAIADVLGSTEGGMGQSVTTKDTPAGETAKFGLSPTTKVFTDDGREVQPGSGEIGMVANGGLVPLGYYKDEEKSARTFREVNGARYSFPGDMARIAADGSLELLGRGSNCINTGGEKVFPEEVEEALKQHPAVEDALVFGVPDDRFGNRIVGVVSLSPGATAAPDDILGHVRTKLSSYKLPRALHVAERVPRAPNGKADYPSAKAIFEASAT
ncbi:MAG: acyl-CoA synthetase [Acidimicrobiales bacterium]|nr:acyl-CoA synthetase [Acidimicrobiales bacterium]MCB9393398.1 acyl-CoA synthetase [Acidimicrobiaceae bacterium]